MDFSIITPSFRSSKWLKLCIPSVADQQNVSLEHIVQDSVSDDGTGEWLPQDRRVQAYIEKDQGMYDAANRGFRRAKGDYLAYLNCDEQYLPGALANVAAFFKAHPEVDAVVADSVVTDSDGRYMSSRFGLAPVEYQMWIRFPVLSCSFFVRRRVIQEMGMYFDTQWRDLGDFFWVLEMLRRGVKMAVLPQFTSVFADTGENMNLKPNALRERQQKWEMAPGWVKKLRYLLIAQYRWRLLLRGAMTQKAFEYHLYTHQSPEKRIPVPVTRPTSRWPGRSPWEKF